MAVDATKRGGQSPAENAGTQDRVRLQASPSPDDVQQADRENRYRSIFNAAKDGILVAAGDTGRITDVNSAFLGMTGLTGDDLIGKIVGEIAPFRSTDVVQIMSADLSSGKRDSLLYYDIPLARSDGGLLAVEIIATAFTIAGAPMLHFSVRDVGRRKSIENELWKTEARLRALFQKAAFGIAFISRDGIIIESNPSLQTMFGYTEEELHGRPVSEFTHIDYRQSDAALFQELLDRKRESYQMTIRCLRKDGTAFWGLLAESLILSTEGEPLYAIRMIEDISARKRAEEVLIKSRNFYLSLIDDLPNPIRRTDTDGQSDYFNRAWLEFTGRSLSQEIGEAWTLGVHPDDADRLRKIQAESLRNRAPYVTEYRLRSRTGEHRWVVEHGRPIYDIDGMFGGYISSCYDVQSRKEFEQTLHSLSTTDELTGLLNRRGFFSLAQQQVKLANRTKRKLLLLYVDLDGLKTINDTLGHPEGDQAIAETAMILREIFRESDIIGRLGGDEFAVLALDQPAIGDESSVILRRLDELVKTRNAAPERRYALSLSAGVNAYDPEHPCTLDELISRADSIMYAKKRAKRRDRGDGPVPPSD